MNLYKEFYRKYQNQQTKTIPSERFRSIDGILRSLKVEEDIAELGVAYGGTIKLINHYFKDTTIYAFDTFEGFAALPKEYTEKEADRWKDWGTKTIEWDKVLEELKQLENVILKKGIFPDTTIGLENNTYSFVHIDTDIYLSTMVGLEYFYPRMVKGGTIVIDDLFSPTKLIGSTFPQVRSAVKDYFEKQGIDYTKIVDFKNNIGHGVIIKE